MTEILNLKLKTPDELERILKMAPKTDVTDIYSLNQLKTMNLRFVDSIKKDVLKQPTDPYRVNELELTSINKMLDIIIGSTTSKL